MRLEEFHEWLKKQPIGDKLVRMKYKYSWEDKWICSNEYLEVDTSVDGNYVWLNDWNEGQEDVEILGCVDVDDMDVPLFEKPMNKGVYYHKMEVTDDFERMRDELYKYCWDTTLCKRNGRKCVFHRYCENHNCFEDNDIKKLYDRMKKRMTEDEIG